MSTYLCYDIRGIQSFIFKVPRLRYIVGGSALVDRFDRETVPQVAKESKVDLVFSAGGRGVFRVSDDAKADEVTAKLVDRARAVGFDVRFGRNADFSEASHNADQLFPYVPSGDQLDGHPCSMSGLYPVGGAKRVHEVVDRRIYFERERLSRWYENRILGRGTDALPLPKPLVADQCAFFRNVSRRDTTDDEAEEVEASAAALGGRNRWAVVCMDGNDMGAQFRKASELWSGDVLERWLERTSKELDDCSLNACRQGMVAALKAWVANPDNVRSATCGRQRERVILPIRPLVVGGDDIIVLIHTDLAFGFVKAACRTFAARARSACQKARGDGLEMWPATGGDISISAGVLFSPVGLPLHASIPYAESLLASAKGKGRQARAASGPAPACIDWESVTEGLVDHPASRRARELRFVDEDIDEVVELTRRPYTLEDFEELEALARSYRDIPATTRHQVLASLRSGAADRMVLVARLGKSCELLARHLLEGGKGRPSLGPTSGGRWMVTANGDGRCTDVVDAMLLLEESARMEWETVR
jgi:hypothetical protein